MPEQPDPPLPDHEIERAVRFSYAQSMLSAIYGASTGGMFLIGYALALGANNVQIGLMSTIPMLTIGVQLLSAMVIERGVSRRRLTPLSTTAAVSNCTVTHSIGMELISPIWTLFAPRSRA